MHQLLLSLSSSDSILCHYNQDLGETLTQMPCFPRCIPLAKSRTLAPLQLGVTEDKIPQQNDGFYFIFTYRLLKPANQTFIYH